MPLNLFKTIKMRPISTKLILLCFLTTSFNFTTAQIGIGTEAPKATLHIAASDGAIKPGVIIPQLSAQELATLDNKYTRDQDGAMVFLTSPIDSTASSPKTKDIFTRGPHIYHHVHKKWISTVDSTQTVSRDKLVVIVNRDRTHLMQSPRERVFWDGPLEGHQSHLIQLEDGNRIVSVPPFMTLKITGMLPTGYSVGGPNGNGKTATTLSSIFRLNQASIFDGIIYSTTPGFSRSSNHSSTAGGATSASMIVYTGSKGLKFSVEVTRSDNRTKIAGGSNDRTVGSYLIIEQI